MVHGGLGLRSSSLLAPAAHWAAWADVLPIIAERAPDLGERVLQELEAAESSVPSIRRAVAAEQTVTQPDFRCKPTWQELVDGARPPQRPQQYDDEPEQWPHGWQFYASLGLFSSTASGTFCHPWTGARKHDSGRKVAPTQAIISQRSRRVRSRSRRRYG